MEGLDKYQGAPHGGQIVPKEILEGLDTIWPDSSHNNFAASTLGTTP